MRSARSNRRDRVEAMAPLTPPASGAMEGTRPPLFRHAFAAAVAQTHRFKMAAHMKNTNRGAARIQRV